MTVAFLVQMGVSTGWALWEIWIPHLEVKKKPLYTKSSWVCFLHFCCVCHFWLSINYTSMHYFKRFGILLLDFPDLSGKKTHTQKKKTTQFPPHCLCSVACFVTVSCLIEYFCDFAICRSCCCFCIIITFWGINWSPRPIEVGHPSGRNLYMECTGLCKD